MKRIEVVISDETRPNYKKSRWDVVVRDHKGDRIEHLCLAWLESEDEALQHVNELRENYEVILL